MYGHVCHQFLRGPIDTVCFRSVFASLGRRCTDGIRPTFANGFENKLIIIIGRYQPLLLTMGLFTMARTTEFTTVRDGKGQPMGSLRIVKSGTSKPMRFVQGKMLLGTLSPHKAHARTPAARHSRLTRRTNQKSPTWMFFLWWNIIKNYELSLIWTNFMKYCKHLNGLSTSCSIDTIILSNINSLWSTWTIISHSPASTIIIHHHQSFTINHY